jgi:hypothetical protein
VTLSFLTATESVIKIVPDNGIDLTCDHRYEYNDEALKPVNS